MGRRSLLEVLQRIIELTYRMDTGVAQIGRYVLGDRGYQERYAGTRIVHSVASGGYPDARILVRQVGDEVYASIYYPDRLIAHLEERNPLRGLDTHNLDAFAVFVEELDHFLTVADRSRAGRQISLFELELHANVTKYFSSRHFLELSLGRPLTPGERQWLSWSLFEKVEPAPAAEDVRARYRDADRLGQRFVLYLDDLTPAHLLSELRAFHRSGHPYAVRRADASLAH